MNFISHYHFYKTEDSYFNLGLVLPDLVKSFCKAHLKPAESYTNPFLKSLNKGSLTHLRADKTFHNTGFFRNTSGFISDLVDRDARWPRKWFLNHLLTEICIDRFLMDQNPGLCSEFYSEIQKPNSAHVENYLKLSGVNNPQNFSPAFDRFVKIAFIFDYLHNESIVKALDRVYNRVGIQYEWTQEDKSLLLLQIPHILNYIEKNIAQLITELKI